MSVKYFEKDIHVGGTYPKKGDGQVTVVEIDRKADPPIARVIDYGDQARRGRRATEIVENEVVLLRDLLP